MLILNRKIGEEIVIGPDICIRVVEITGKRVKLGCSGPREVPIRRREIEEREPLRTVAEVAGCVS